MDTISNSSKREVRLGELFVTIADTLVADFDLSDLLQTLVDETTALLPVDQAALFLDSGDGTLRVAAATSSHARAVEDLILEVDASPCLDAYRTGLSVGVDSLAAAKPEWGEFANILRAASFEASYAIPMRLRGDTIGVLSLFSSYPYVPSELDAAVAQSLADAATIAILQNRVAAERLVLAQQLQHALESRVLIEQAKGVVAQTRTVSMAEAFTLIRAHARQNNETLREVSQRIAERSLSI
jgi:GAF domain-containing protein